MINSALSRLQPQGLSPWNISAKADYSHVKAAPTKPVIEGWACSPVGGACSPEQQDLLEERYFL